MNCKYNINQVYVLKIRFKRIEFFSYVRMLTLFLIIPSLLFDLQYRKL